MRDEAVKKLGKYFKKSTAQGIEEGIHQYSVQYCKSVTKYGAMYDSVYEHSLANALFNLASKNLTMVNAIRMLKQGDMLPHNVAFLKPQEMNEILWKHIADRFSNTRNALENLPTVTYEACEKCGNTEYYYYQAQTRGADEPMTIYYYCKGCDFLIKI